MKFQLVQRLLLSLSFLSACGTAATDGPSLEELARLKPLAPEEALKSFEIAEGFHLELVAAEPNVADPIAIAFDENGRMYVAEMRDYPSEHVHQEKPPSWSAVPPPPGGGPAGRIRLLEDVDGDGFFEKSTIFAERVHWPSGIACWQGGVFVAAPPDIYYMKDTTGDRVADVRELIFTGFGTGKSEDIMNNLKWGLDHWIYGASSSNGGRVSHAKKRDAGEISVRGHDFRFHPLTEAFEAIEGTGGDFGNTFDDWGNRFTSNSGAPLIHSVIPSRYIERNPDLLGSQLANRRVFQSDDREVYSISQPEPWRVVRQKFWSRWVDTTHEMRASRFSARELSPQGYMTGGAAVEIYRGSVYPETFRGNAFWAEPAGNLVLRSVLEQAGVTFAARRADTKKEFIASSDNWFRPVNFVNGPDGCLYIADMYREVIEHPSAIPDDILKQLDYYSGMEMGRIYRIVPNGFRRSEPPRLAQAGTQELVNALEHPDGWWRDTAHRLLFERQDRTAADALKRLIERSKLPQARLHALWSLAGLGLLDETSLLRGLEDSHPAVQEHAIRLAEKRLRESQQLRSKVLTMTNDENPRVRFQTALTLSPVEGDDVVRGLAQIARHDPSDQWTRTAVLTAAPTRSVPLFKLLVNDASFVRLGGGLVFLKELASFAGSRNNVDEIFDLLTAARQSLAGRDSEVSFGILSGLAEGLVRSGGSLQTLRESRATPGPVKAILDESFLKAKRVALDSRGSIPERLEAIYLLGHAPSEMAVNVLTDLLSAREASEIQLAAVRSLSLQRRPEVGQILVDRWRSFSPSVRGEVVEALFSQEDRFPPLLQALETEAIPMTHLEPFRRQALMNHTQLAIRNRATKLFSKETESRKQVVERYRSVLVMSGDPSQGERVFEGKCATCHRLGSKGIAVGPDLSGVLGRSDEELLVDILDPNAKVQSNYINYRLDTVEGRIVTGLIARETPNSVTLRRAEGVEDVVARSNIKSLNSMGLSLMPEGLEEEMSRGDLADLISFIQSKRKGVAAGARD